jgi:hypothetical protein
MSTPALGSLLAEGFRVLGTSPTVDVPPSLRLKIYDSLAGCDAVSRAVSGSLWEVDFSTGDGTRYWQLALATARHALPVWETFIQARGPDADDWRRFPHELVEAAEQMASGVRQPSMLEEADPWTAIGALPYVVNYNAAEVALAAYGALAAVNGLGPFHSLPIGIDLDRATDLDLNRHSGNLDVAWHAAQAFSALDRDLPGAEKRTKIGYDREKRFAFWEWWFARVASVASV